MERSLSVLDGAITILDASAGVEAQTYTVWSQANRHDVPRIIYLNKMDKPAANVSQCLESIESKLAVKPLLIHLPIDEAGKNFHGIVDLVSREVYSWNEKTDQTGGIFETNSLNSLSSNRLRDMTAKLREELIGVCSVIIQ